MQHTSPRCHGLSAKHEIPLSHIVILPLGWPVLTLFGKSEHQARHLLTTMEWLWFYHNWESNLHTLLLGIMSPQPKWGDILLLVWIPLELGIRVASCLHSIFSTNGWILTKLAQTHYWEGGKKWFRFWWPWSHFQGHTSNLNYQILTKKAYLHPISWTKWRILAKFHIL